MGQIEAHRTVAADHVVGSFEKGLPAGGQVAINPISGEAAESVTEDVPGHDAGENNYHRRDGVDDALAGKGAGGDDQGEGPRPRP